MYRKKHFPFRVYLLAAFLLQAFPVFSQDTIPKKDSIIREDHLGHQVYTDPVVIRANKEYGVRTDKPDSIFQARYASGTVTDLLGQNGFLFLKTYGGGSLATTSVRGASESQTPVLWNGINLQSPTNGNVDLSLLPTILFDNVSIQNSASSIENAGGGIGGVINTGTYLSFTGKKVWNVKYVGLAGSFGEINNGLKIGYSHGRFCADIRAYRQQAENNFTFINITSSGNPIDTLKNGDFLQQGIQGETKFALGSRNYLTARCWYQSSDRGIAPSMFEINGNSRQTDRFLRSLVEWKFVGDDFYISTKSAALTEAMEFDPGFSQPSSFTKALSFVNEVVFQYNHFHFIKISAGISDTRTQAEVTQFIPLKKQNRASVFVETHYESEKIRVAVNFREEEVDGNFVSPVGSVGCDWFVFKWFVLKGYVSKNYRVPTFNDLYWNPGGNPDLKAESSLNEELTAGFYFDPKISNGKLTLSYTATVFNRNTENWIQWTPGAAYWSPHNLLSVWSRGAEHRVKINYAVAKWKFTFLGGYDYVRATNEKSAIPNDPSVGLQLMYLPADRWNATIQIDYRKFYIAYLHQFTDLRFTSTDHSTYLPAFSTAQLTIGKRIDYKDSFGDVFFRINNLFDTEYQVIPYRAMPGRYFQIGISIDFNKKSE